MIHVAIWVFDINPVFLLTAILQFGASWPQNLRDHICFSLEISLTRGCPLFDGRMAVVDWTLPGACLLLQSKNLD
jgi:hypothetical protein